LVYRWRGSDEKVFLLEHRDIISPRLTVYDDLSENVFCDVFREVLKKRVLPEMREDLPERGEPSQSVHLSMA
jgi:hypothetical protein